MYRFAVCDDSSADRAYVTALIEAWGCSRDILLQIEDYPSAEAFLFAYEGNETVDVLFLDIEMGDMSGVELAKRLRQMGAGLQIVCLTG